MFLILLRIFLISRTVLICQNLTSFHNHGKIVTLPSIWSNVRNTFVMKSICRMLCDKGDASLKIADINGNKMLRIFTGFLCLLIFFTVLACSCVPKERDSKWIGYTQSGKASYYAMKSTKKKSSRIFQLFLGNTPQVRSEPVF